MRPPSLAAPSSAPVHRGTGKRGFVNEPLSSSQLTDQRAVLASPTWSNERLQYMLSDKVGATVRTPRCRAAQHRAGQLRGPSRDSNFKASRHGSVKEWRSRVAGSAAPRPHSSTPSRISEFSRSWIKAYSLIRLLPERRSPLAVTSPHHKVFDCLSGVLLLEEGTEGADTHTCPWSRHLLPTSLLVEGSAAPLERNRSSYRPSARTRITRQGSSLARWVSVASESHTWEEMSPS